MGAPLTSPCTARGDTGTVTKTIEDSAGGARKSPREYQDYIETALALKDLGFRLDEIKPLTRLALGRSVSAGQRDSAARLVEDRIDALARQVDVLRRLRDSVRGPDAGS